MRFVFAIVVAVILAACALEQSSSERAFVDGGSNGAQVARDADVIMQGMTRAQYDNQRVARDTNTAAPAPTIAR